MKMNRVTSFSNGRSNSGSMLGLAMMATAAVVFLFVIGLSLYVFWGREKLGENRTEFKALTIANALNEGDRVGQMNYVVARSRELVYLSREAEKELYRTEDSQVWTYLARQLCDDAREGAQQVELERQHQVAMAKAAVSTLAFRFNEESSKGPSITTSFWESSPTFVKDVNVGWVKNVDSNVLHPDTEEELHRFDETKGYFLKTSNLYRGNINAKLPEPDDDLDFKLCALASAVEDSIAPTRLIKPQAFVPGLTCYKDEKTADGKLDQIPTAVHVRQRMTVKVENEAVPVPLDAQAASRGAGPPPR